MGFIDNFTSDTPVTIKHDEYYALMREATKAELLMNAVKAGVPSWYVDAMATGELKEPVFESKDLEGCEENLFSLPPEMDCCMWGRLAAAIKDVFNDAQNEEEIKEMKAAMAELTRALERTRATEIYIRSQRETPPDRWSCNTCSHNHRLKTECDTCEDGSNYRAKESEGVEK